MKKAILIASVFILLFVSVSAITKEEVWRDKPNINIVEAPSLWDKILNFFKTEDFTIVGQARQCDVEPLFRGNGQILYFERGFNLGYWSYSPGTVGSSTLDASRYCSSGHGMFDIYCQPDIFSSDVGSPRFEMEDWVYFTCGGTCAKCNVELYCCPDGGCASNSDCPNGECKTDYRTDSLAPLKSPSTGQTINSFKYCIDSQGCTGADKTCWRIGSSNTCESATYSCDYSTYNTITSTNCASGAGTYIYSSQSVCQSNICTPTPKTTACSGKVCGQVPTGCGNDWTCGTCSTGQTCSAGQCVNSETLKNVGEECSSDSQCASKDCSEKRWIFGLPIGPDICQPIPWGEAKRIAVTSEEISTMTTTDMLSISCQTNSQCISPNSNYSASCVNLETLKERGIVSSPSVFLDSAKTTIDSAIGGATLGAIAGIGLCAFGVGASTVAVVMSAGVATPIVIPAAATCSALIGSGAAIGAGAGYSLSQFAAADKDDPLVKALQEKDSTKVGLCVATQNTSSFSSLDFLKFLAFMDVDRNGTKDGVDGLIIGIILLVLIIILLK